MPMNRKLNYKEPLEMLVEILVDVQLEGSFEKYDAPHWSEGTACEEVINAVRLIGDGEWLSEHYAVGAAQGNAEQWLTEYLQGKSVPLPTDKAVPKKTKNASKTSSAASIDPSLPEAIQEYLSNVSAKIRDRLSERLSDDGTLDKFVKHMEDLGMGIGLCLAPNVTEKMFMSTEKPFMDPAALADIDMLLMSRYHLVDCAEELFEVYEVSGPQLKTARARCKWFCDNLVAPDGKTASKAAPAAKNSTAKSKPKTKS